MCFSTYRETPEKRGKFFSGLGLNIDAPWGIIDTQESISSYAINKLIVYGEGSTKMFPSFFQERSTNTDTFLRLFTMRILIKNPTPSVTLTHTVWWEHFSDAPLRAALIDLPSNQRIKKSRKMPPNRLRARFVPSQPFAYKKMKQAFCSSISVPYLKGIPTYPPTPPLFSPISVASTVSLPQPSNPIQNIHLLSDAQWPGMPSPTPGHKCNFCNLRL